MRRPLSTIVIVLLLFLLPFTSASNVHEGSPSLVSEKELESIPAPDTFPDVHQYLSAIDGHFTENLGQLGHSEVDLYCLGHPLSVAFGRSCVYYDLKGRSGPEGATIRVDFRGANPVRPVGFEPLEHRSNFFIGDDPSDWVSGARNFGGVAFPSLYEGIDLQYYMQDGMLKYDFLVGPGADTSDIRVSFGGILGLEVDEVLSDLVIHTPAGTLRDDTPIAYQGGSHRREPVDVSYRLVSPEEFTWEVGSYDPSLPLVIDPGLEFSTFLGGSDEDYFWGSGQMAVDDDGDLYIVGYSESPDFPTTPGAYQQDLNNRDGFIFKMRGDGASLIYCTFLGGSNNYDPVHAVQVDGEGCAYLAGVTRSSDFPTTPGVFNDSYTGAQGMHYLSKLDENGSSLVYSTFICQGVYVCTILLDDYGRVYVGGSTSKDDLPTVEGCLNTTFIGYADGYLLLINHDATKVLAGTYFGGTVYDELRSISQSDDKTILVSMITESTGLKVSDEAYMDSPGGYRDTYLAKVNLDLTEVKYGTYLGGASTEYVFNAVTDDKGNVYVTGSTQSADFPTTSDAFDRTVVNGDTYITILDKKLKNILFSTLHGGSDYDYGCCIQWTPHGDIIVIGLTRSDDLLVTSDAFDSTLDGWNDIYVVRLHANYSLKYASYLGGSNQESTILSVHHDVNTTIVGVSYSHDYPVTSGAYDTSYSGNGDIVVTRLWTGLTHDATPPRPPREFKASSGDRNVSLSWRPPKDWSGGPLLGYNLYRGTTEDGLSLIASLDMRLNYTDHPPIVGRTYYYAISAINGKGEGNACPVVGVVSIGAPAVPRDIALEVDPASAVITWNPPKDSGGFPLLGYRLFRGTDAGRLSHLVDLGNVTGHRDQDLVNGIEYFYAAAAFNSYGNSTFSGTVSGIPRAPPSEPRYLEIEVGNGQLTLVWTIPEFDNGSMLSGYRIFRGTDPSDLQEIDTISDSFTFYTDTGLTNGLTYYYAIQAINDIGNGSLSRMISGTPIGVPWVPTNLRFEAMDAAVSLSWDPPVNEGGMPVTGYSVYRGSTHLIFNAVGYVNVTTFEDTNLDNGMTYLYKVTASNSQGEGPSTGSVSVVPLGLPDPPTDLTITSGLDGIHLVWQPPWETGGVPLTGYVVYRGTDPTSMDRLSELPDTIEELTDDDVTIGQTYYYSVSTLSIVGGGPPTVTVSETAVASPGPSSNVNAEPGNGQVRITWSPPADNGSLPIEGYVVMRWTRGEPVEELKRLGPVVFHVDYDVENDREYLYYVLAFNSIAQGPKSQTVIATPFAPKFAPSEPLDLELRAHGTKAVLTWDVPIHDGGTPITGYQVLRGSSLEDLETIAELGFIHSYVDQEIEQGVGYFYAVKAVNDAGQGNALEPQRFVIEQVQDTVDDDQGGVSMAMVGISLAVVLIILVLLAIMLSRKRRSGEGQEGAELKEDASDGTSQDELEGSERDRMDREPPLEIEIEERIAR